MITIGWDGDATTAPHLASIGTEIVRAALSDPLLCLHTVGYPYDATDPLWQLGARWLTDPPGAAHRFDIQLVPLARPPLDGDALAQQVLAAMREGIPVIGTARWPLRALLVSGVTGILIPPLRPRQWNRQILRLASDSRLRTAMGTAARAAAQTMQRPADGPGHKGRRG